MSFVVVVSTARPARGPWSDWRPSPYPTSGDARDPAAVAGRPAAGAAGGDHLRRPRGRRCGDGRAVHRAGARSPRAGGRWPSPRRWPTPAPRGRRWPTTGSATCGSPPRSPAATPAPRRSSWPTPAGRCSRPPTPRSWASRFDVGDSTVLTGRSWTGERPFDGGPAAAAMAPIYADDGAESLGFVAVQRLYPSILDGLAAATPNLLTYLGLASALGIGGSLLRRPPGEAADARPGAGRDRRPGRAPRRHAPRHPRGDGRPGPARAGSRSSTTRRSGCCASPATPSAGRWPTSGWGRRCATRCSRVTWSATAPSPPPVASSWSTGCRSPAAAARSAR